MNVDWALRVLNLNRGSTDEDLKRAYRREAQVWHPDRYLRASEAEQADAVEQMKRLNVAYEYLQDSTEWKVKTKESSETRSSTSSDTGTSETTTKSSPHESSASQTNNQASKSESAQPSESQATSKKNEETLFEAMKKGNSSAEKKSDNTSSGWTRFAIWLCVVGVAGAIRAYNAKETSSSLNSNVASNNSKPYTPPTYPEIKAQNIIDDSKLAEPIELIDEPIKFKVDRKPEFKIPPSHEALPTTPNQPISGGSGRQISAEELPVAAGIKASASSPPIKDYFTIGSAFDEVIALQGTPDSISGSRNSGMIWYGSSYVEFSAGRVSSYDNSGGKLKIRLLSIRGMPKAKYFTIGSTYDEVVAIQGTPESISGSRSSGMIWYGSSYVEFSAGRVSTYDNSGGKLKIRLLPLKGTRKAKYFTLGSSFDDVISVQGTPESISGSRSAGMIWYGSSYVEFSGGRVSSYDNSGGRLKVKLN